MISHGGIIIGKSERKYLIEYSSGRFIRIIPVAHHRTGLSEHGSLVIRIRKDNNKHELTYKSKGLMAREEYNLPLDEASYQHLLTKIDGRLIRKKRYMIPLNDSLTIELDVFEDDLAPLLLAEVEFPDEASALSFTPPEWFGTDVTFSSEYHNSTLSLK